MRDKMSEIAFFLVNEVVVNAENTIFEQFEKFSNPIFGSGRKILFSGGHTARLMPTQSQIANEAAHKGPGLSQVKH